MYRNALKGQNMVYFGIKKALCFRTGLNIPVGDF